MDISHIVEIDGVEAHRYDIGGVCVTMTEAQAAAWNSGDATEASCRGAYVSVPRHTGDRSCLRDGEVLIWQGLPYEDSVPLWEYIGGDDEHGSDDYVRWMEGMTAIRC